MVLKPSEKVPFSALLLADILYEAGLPPEMFQVVTGDPAEIADELLTNPASTSSPSPAACAIGKYIAGKIGYRRTVLELGGNDPLIVMDDADLDEASSLAVAGSYKNSGQRCTAVKRMIVQEAVADHFVELLLEKSRRWRYGDPCDEASTWARLSTGSRQDCSKLASMKPSPRARNYCSATNVDGALYSPTVLDHVRPEMTLVREETFGPVSPVIRFKTLDEAIAIVNGTAYGLSSGVVHQPARCHHALRE